MLRFLLMLFPLDIFVTCSWLAFNLTTSLFLWDCCCRDFAIRKIHGVDGFLAFHMEIRRWVFLLPVHFWGTLFPWVLVDGCLVRLLYFGMF